MSAQIIVESSSGSNALTTDVFDAMFSINKAVNDIQQKGKVRSWLLFMLLVQGLSLISYRFVGVS